MPNRIFYKPSNKIYEVTIGNISVEKKFIREIGTCHPTKAEKFKKILVLKSDETIDNHLLIGLHFKEEIRTNKSKLYKMGGNLSRVLKSSNPLTRGFYKKASMMVKLPPLDDFIIEKIKSAEPVNGTGYVYDMTIPETHNFLIETGFVSSNCHDIGKQLGAGAHMAELRRIRVGPFDESTACTLQDLKDAFVIWKEKRDERFIRKVIQPIESAVKDLPKVFVNENAIESVIHGRDLGIPGILKMSEFVEGETVALMTADSKLIALGSAGMSTEKIEKRKKGIAVRTDKVFMREF